MIKERGAVRRNNQVKEKEKAKEEEEGGKQARTQSSITRGTFAVRAACTNE
jgi:hypothetical protein